MSQSTPSSRPPSPATVVSSAFTPVRRVALDEQIAETILRAVIDGELPVGEPLPAERELADRLAVNRTSLRQALARLEQIGVVRSRQGSGTVVQDPATLTDPVVVQMVARSLGPELLDEVLEVRSALGELMGRLAAEHSAAAERGRLSAALDKVRAASDAAARQVEELAFWAELVAATRNRPLAALTRWVAATYGAAPEGFTAAFEDAEEIVGGLERIVAAVEHGDGDAAGRAAQHYLEVSGRRMAVAALDAARRNGRR